MTVLELYADIDNVGSSSLPVQSYQFETQLSMVIHGQCTNQFGAPRVKVDMNIDPRTDDDNGNMPNIGMDMHSENGEEDDEGDVPEGDSSDTEVEGDFDANVDSSIHRTFVAVSLDSISIHGDCQPQETGGKQGPFGTISMKKWKFLVWMGLGELEMNCTLAYDSIANMTFKWLLNIIQGRNVSHFLWLNQSQRF